MRKPLVAGNWKMNKTLKDAVQLAADLKPLVADVAEAEIVVCPVSVCLADVAETLAGSNISVGAQNCYAKESGAYTGEVSPQMLLAAGCQWTIIGHSERRTIFEETDELLNEKLLFAMTTDIKVMFCIGETLEERESGKMDDVITRQVTAGLKGLEPAHFEKIAVAYEPVWAIGTGVTATPEQAQEAHQFVRKLIAREFGGDIAENLRIQYGGSVKPDNVEELMAKPDVDGSLVGGASLTADGFAAIVKGSVSA